MFIKYRNATVHFLYVYILKPILFLFDPEDIHDLFINIGKFLGKYSLLRFKTRIWFSFSDKRLEQNILGIKFVNPIGLAAGFDKNAELLDIFSDVGFGFVEIGSVTGFPCKGNPKPRLWRLPKSSGLVVYYGLKNNGCEEISNRIKNKKSKIPFGMSVAMTNRPENLYLHTAVDDYDKAFRSFIGVGDYITVNISCPNTEGGQPFLDPEKLDILLSKLDLINTSKPIFVKMSPDKSFEEVDKVLEILKKHKISGIICTNLTKKRENSLIFDKNIPKIGGISGKPLQNMSDDLLSYIYKKEKNRFVLIGCGGVFSAKDAYKKIRLGASLVQLITGMIFEGPQLISEINRGLVELLDRDGFSNISEAIGVDFK